MSLMRRVNHAGTGSASVTVHGGSLGLVAYTSMVRSGATGCEGTEWESETSVRCLAGRGTRGTRRVVMTAGDRAGSGTAVFSLDSSGAVSAITGVLNRASTGSLSFTVHGARLGSRKYSMAVRARHTACEATGWESDTAVRCLHQASWRGTKRVAITSGERVGTGSQMYRMSTDLGIVSAARKTNRAGTGSTSLTVHGAGFEWATWYSQQARYTSTACEGTEWESETSVRCKAGHGRQGTRRLTLTAGRHLRRSMTEAYSVDVGSVSLMRRVNHAGTGSASVTVHGGSLGLVAYTSMVRSGATGCEGTEWESETSVRCLVGRGARATRRVVMTAGDVAGTGSDAMSWDAYGSVSAITGVLNRASTGSSSLTVHGAGLGSRRYSLAARARNTACEATAWESDSSVRCLHQASFRGTKRVSITSGERVGSGTEMFMMSIDKGVVSTARKTNRAGTGSTSVTVHGGGFEWVTWYSQQARYSSTGCEGTEWESETSVRCKTGHGYEGTRRLALTAGKRLRRSISEAYTVDGLSLIHI